MNFFTSEEHLASFCLKFPVSKHIPPSMVKGCKSISFRNCTRLFKSDLRLLFIDRNQGLPSFTGTVGFKVTI
ncbi:hypothetical protein ACEQUB_p00784 (plasmid) [Ralstonia syzygii]